jgi:hypothetical protein
MTMSKTQRRHHKIFTAEIEARGGEITISHMPYGRAGLKNIEHRELEIVDTGRSEGRKVWLLRAEGWRYYSRRFGARPAHLAYLCGYDDAGAWAVRVPGTIERADEAVEWLTPATVTKARAAGKRVLRQGDVYAVETVRRCDGSGSYSSDDDWRVQCTGVQVIDVDGPGVHCWYPRARVLVHSDPARPHRPLQVPYPARFVQQRAYQMGRGAGIGGAD